MAWHESNVVAIPDGQLPKGELLPPLSHPMFSGRPVFGVSDKKKGAWPICDMCVTRCLCPDGGGREPWTGAPGIPPHRQTTHGGHQ